MENKDDIRAFIELLAKEPIQKEKSSADLIADEELRSKVLENKEKEQDIEQRREFATKIYRLVSIYLIVVGLIVICAGVEIFPFELSDTILGIILGTTTANVLALFHFVARYLFSEKRIKEENK